MKKIITSLMALAVAIGMMKAADSTFLYNHYSQNFSTVTGGDWGTVDSLGAVVTNYTNGFNVNGTNQNLELKIGSSSQGKNTGRNVYKNWFLEPITSPDSISISFIYKNAGTVSGTGNYLYFCDANRKPIFGIGGDRSKNAAGSNAWVPRLPLKFVSLKDSTKNFIIGSAQAPQISGTEGAFKVNVIINFAKKTYTITALKGTYTPTASPNFVAGTEAMFTRTAQPFLDSTAVNISWLMHTMGSSGGTLSTTYIFAYLDDVAITQIKTYQGNANIAINAVDQEGNVVKTYAVSAPIGQRYSAIGSDLLSFDANGSYYVYDAANTTSLQTTCTADGLSKIDIKFIKSTSHVGPFVWAPAATPANWNETETNFVSVLNEPTAYQKGRSVIFNTNGSSQTVQIASVIDLIDQNWTVNGKKLIFSGIGAVKTSGDANLNLAPSDTIQILTANSLSGKVNITGGTTTMANGAFGSGKIFIEKDAAINMTGSSFIGNEIHIAEGATFSLITNNTNYQGLSSKLYGSGDIKLVAWGPRVLYGANMSSWTGKKVTIVAKGANLAGGANVALNSDSTLLTLSNTELVLDSLVKVSAGTGVLQRTATVGALSGAKTATLGALIDVANTAVSSYWRIGALNTNTEYAGTISNTMYIATSSANKVYVEKIGTGTLTLSGKSLPYSGNTVVSEGKLIMKGNLTSTSDTVIIAPGAIMEVIGARERDTLGVMQYVRGTIAGDVKVNGTLVAQSAYFNTPTALTLNANSTLEAQVLNDSVPAASTLICQIDPTSTLKITPVNSYNAGDVFRVFSAEAVPFIIGSFGTITDAAKWDISQLYVAGTVKALEAGLGMGVERVVTTKVRAYFLNGSLVVSGLAEGDTYRVVNTSGSLVNSHTRMANGIYIVVVRTAKGNTVSLKAINFNK